MPINTTPIFIASPHVQWAYVSESNASAAANNFGTGVLGTDIQLVFSASYSGSRVDSITIHPLGTNVQTNISFFINNGQNNAVSTNNAAFYDVTMNATTISAVSALPRTELQFPNGINIASGSRILVSIGTTVATGFSVIAYGGDY
jgi:hypothetical protein